MVRFHVLSIVLDSLIIVGGVYQGRPNFSLQRATTVIVGWFAGHTCKAHHMRHTSPPKLYIYIYIYIANSRRPRFGYPWFIICAEITLLRSDEVIMVKE